MNYTKAWIEDAIKGGWQPKSKRELKYSGCNSEWSVWNFVDEPNKGSSICELHEVTLLNPKAWEAVGEVRGWELGDWNVTEQKNDGTDWITEWHKFIDYLADEYSIEEALQAIE